MSDEWYSRKPATRFSREHRAQLPAGARMIDLDGLVYAPYAKGKDGGAPLILVEFKPERAKEDYWYVTRQLALLAGIPAARVIEQANGRYTIHVGDQKPSEEQTGYKVVEVGCDLDIADWFRLVEEPLRRRAGHVLPPSQP